MFIWGIIKMEEARLERKIIEGRLGKGKEV